MRLLLLFVLLVANCRGDDDKTLSFIRLVIHTCSREKFFDVDHKGISTTLTTLNTCMKNSFPCDRQIKPRVTTRTNAQGRNLYVIRNVEKNICGFLTWRPIRGYDFVLHKWHIRTRERWFVRLNFEYFYIPYTVNCEGNRMVLAKFKSGQHGVLAEYCGYRLPWAYNFDTNEADVWILWANNGVLAPQVSLQAHFETLVKKPKDTNHPIRKSAAEIETPIIPSQESPIDTDGGRMVYAFEVHTYIENILHVQVSTGRSAATEWFIYDGPTDSFPLLYDKMTTSGFLLFIKVYGFDVGLSFKFTAEQQTNISCSFDSAGNVRIHKDRARLLFCRTWFKADEYPSIHLDKFNVLAPEPQTCKFLGFAVGFDVNGTTTMLKPFCTPHAQTERDPYFVAPTSRVFLFIYVYEALLIDIDINIYESSCPGIPVMCQSPDFRIPKQIDITDRACLTTGTSNHLELLSYQCVYLFRLPNMNQCSRVRISHITGSSFTLGLYGQKHGDLVRISNQLADLAHDGFGPKLVTDEEHYRVGLRYEAILLGSQTLRTQFLVSRSSTRYSEVSILDETQLITHTKLIENPKMWYLELQSKECFKMELSPYFPYYFKDSCGVLQTFRSADFDVTIEVPAGHHIAFGIDVQVPYCRLWCPHSSSMEVTEKDMIFVFVDESWETKWRTMSRTAKFIIKVEACHNRLRGCNYEFSYQAHKNKAVLEAENIEGSSQCRIGESRYMVLRADTWMEAKGKCERESGWQMLSISNRNESDALLANAVLHPQCSRKWSTLFSAELVFIGLHKQHGNALTTHDVFLQPDENSQWEWASKEKMKVSDWILTSRYATTDPKVFIGNSAEEKIKSAYLKLKLKNGGKIRPNLPELCAGMTLFNQHVAPKWLVVHCTTRFDAVVVCEKRDERSTGSPTFTTPLPGVTEPPELPTVPSNHSFCPMYWSWGAGRCWQLVDLHKSSCPAISNRLVVDDTDLLLISDMLSLWHTDLLLGEDELVRIGRVINSSQCVAMQRQDERFQAVRKSCTLQDKARFALCEADALNSSSLTCPNGTVMCRDNSCILLHKQCDGTSDCPQGEDEIECSMKPPCSPGSVKCPADDACIKVHQLCDGIKACGEQLCQAGAQCSPDDFKCGLTCLHTKHQCDLEFDCPGQADERSCAQTQYCKLLKSFNTGSNLLYRLPSEVQCPLDQNHTFECTDFGEEFSRCPNTGDEHQCFPRYRRCFYDLDVNGDVLFCMNRQHLQNCESFKCPNAYKCPGSYCVPYVRLCDEVVDCPGGEDELNCLVPAECEGKIRCSDRCILKSDWCNGIIDCPDGEDEKLCSECPSGCVCDLHSTNCLMATWLPQNEYFRNKISLALRQMKIEQNDILDLFPSNADLVQLDLSGNLLTVALIDQGHEAKMKLIDLNLAYNLIKQISSYDFATFPRIMHLNLTGNPLQSISDYAFWHLSLMTDLDLSGLWIDNIYDEAFAGMYWLSSLNLSHNKIRVLGSESFSGLQRLQVLDLDYNPLFLINKETFQAAPVLELLYTPAFKFCCAASHVGKCFPEPSEFSSCSDLMESTILKAFIWVLAFTTFIGNISVIVWRKQQETFSILNFLVQHLGFADMTMGLYLIIIAIADFYYRGHYYLYDEQWRESVFCKTAGFLSMLSSEMSVFVLLIIVTDRVNVVGLARPGMGEKLAYAYVVLGWIVAIVLSVLPIVGLPYFGSGKYIQNGACFLFNITEGKVAGWEYATAIFIVFNLFALLVLVCGYTFTFISVSLKTGFKSNVEGQVARKLALVVMTDCCCWIPPITIGIMSLMDIEVNPQLAVWVAVFAFPLNSTINPFLYTFSSMKCCEEIELMEDDYMSHVHHIDEDGHSISDDGDFAGPSTSTAVVCTIAAKQSKKPRKSLARRTTPRPRSMRKSAKARQGDQKSGAAAVQKSAYFLDQARTTLDDIPEVVDASEEDETNVQISVSVAIKSKGHRRTSSTVSKVSGNDGRGATTNAEDDDQKCVSFAVTDGATALPDDQAAINIELVEIKNQE